MRIQQEGECWNWTGYLNENGYGRVHFGRGKNEYAHRLAYELYHGPILAGLTIDHLCRNPRCVNPMHLEAVSMRTNTLRGDGPTAWRSRQTHCIHGHEFDVRNTYWNKYGHRQCRACKRRMQKERVARLRASG